MKTIKLFWENPYITEFKGKILSITPCQEDPAKFVLLMDQTAFYPEGGGQPWDEGYIGDCNVLYVYEKEDKIYHVVDQAPTSSDELLCKINWKRRFDFMQQHLGQHILSSVFEKLYQADTVGFHIGTQFVTIDISKSSLSIEEAKEVERHANEIIYQNLPVYTHFPTQKELNTFPLRKPPAVTEGIRIVEIQQLDYSPCSGTHPSNTGSVGIVKIRKWEKMKGNIRVEFVCGSRALSDYWWKNHHINDMSNLLSVKDIEVKDSLSRLVEENKSLLKKIKTMKQDLLQYRAKELYAQAQPVGPFSLIMQIFEDEDFQDIRFMASTLSHQPGTIVLLATKTEKAQVVFARSQDVPIDMNRLFQEVIPLIGGKGGGTPLCAQGGGEDLNNLEGLLTAAHQKMIYEYIK